MHTPSTEALRLFLRARLTPEMLLDIANNDYGFDAKAIADAFRCSLDTGFFDYDGHGNPYECALLQRHIPNPLSMIFAAWWLGTFCSDPDRFVLIDNLIPNGVDCLLHMLVRGCGELNEGADIAARAAFPFVNYIQERTNADEYVDREPNFAGAAAALRAIERLAHAGMQSAEYRDFISHFEKL